MKKTGILIVQLGSPKTPAVKDVKKFLREFLTDPRLIPYQNIGWRALLELVILPTRSPKSAEAYASIWDGKEFPLTRETVSFRKGIEGYLDDYELEHAYLIGQGPYCLDALNILKSKGCSHIRVIPLYPQYSGGTTPSIQDALDKIKAEEMFEKIEFLNDFHDTKAFASAVASNVLKTWEKGDFDKVLLSYHGFPKDRIFDGDPYFEQCHRGASLIAKELEGTIKGEDVIISFQSKFGRAEWLTPGTLEKLEELAQQGVKRVAIACPSFISDNLETMEEIAIEAKEEFISYGGEDLVLVPGLNDDEQWCIDFSKEIASVPCDEIKREDIPSVEGLEIPDQGVPPEKLSKSSVKTLKLLGLILFLDLMGFSIIFPLFPSLLDYYIGLEGNTGLLGWTLDLLNTLHTAGGMTKAFSTAVLFGGLLSFLYTIIQFLLAPLFGSISDKVGRKPILVFSMIGIATSYLIWGFAGSFLTLIIARLLGGIMGSNISTATAVVADITTQKTRGKGMAAIGIAFGMGFVFGPVIGGLSSLIDLSAIFPSLVQYGVNPFSTPAFLSMIFSITAVYLVITKLPETLSKEVIASGKVEGEGRTINPLKLFKSEKLPGVNRVSLANLTFLGAFSGAEFSLTFIAAERLGFSSMQNGLMFLYVGVLLTLVQGGYVRRKAAIVGERILAKKGLYSLIPSMVIIGFSYNVWMLFLGLTLMSWGSALVIPSITSLVSRYTPAYAQGRVIGVFRSLGALGRAIGPPIAAVVYGFGGSLAAYIFAAVALVVPTLFVLKLPVPPED
ncbi:ferrochelatase [bacterium]|nr:ferrochelatase [bacterium]